MKNLEKIINLGVNASLFLAITGLLFRATLYWTYPAAEADKFGTGDLIDFIFVSVLFLVVALTFGLSIVLNMKQEHPNVPENIKSISISVFSFLGYYFIHPYVPNVLS